MLSRLWPLRQLLRHSCPFQERLPVLEFERYKPPRYPAPIHVMHYRVPGYTLLGADQYTRAEHQKVIRGLWNQCRHAVVKVASSKSNQAQSSTTDMLKWAHSNTHLQSTCTVQVFEDHCQSNNADDANDASRNNSPHPSR